MVKRGGRFSGEAFAVLPASTQMDFALAKNKTYMGKRYVEVFRAKKLVSTPQQGRQLLLSLPSAYVRIVLPLRVGMERRLGGTI